MRNPSSSEHPKPSGPMGPYAVRTHEVTIDALNVPHRNAKASTSRAT